MSEDSRNKITVFEDGWYDRSRFESKFITAEPIPDEEHIPANTYIDNLTAYYLPHLEYNLSDRTTKIQFFKTESELRAEIVHLRTQLKLTTLINF